MVHIYKTGNNEDQSKINTTILLFHFKRNPGAIYTKMHNYLCILKLPLNVVSGILDSFCPHSFKGIYSLMVKTSSCFLAPGARCFKGS